MQSPESGPRGTARGSLILVLACAALAVGSWSAPVSAQTSTLVVQPGPGANDGTDEGSAAAGKDTYDLRNQHAVTANTNNGTTPLTHHFNSNCNTWVGRSYYQFDVSSLPAADLVTDVTLVLYQEIGRSFGGYQFSPTTTMVVQAVEAPWNEMALTFNTRPPVSAAIQASVDIPTVSAVVAFEGQVSVDITDLYRDWRSGARQNFGFAYSRPALTCENTNYNYTATSDHTDEAKRPALVITYLDDAPPPPPPPPGDSCQGVQDGLVSCWAGDGDALDSVGTNHGSLHNGAAFAGGLIGQAFLVDGVDDYVQFPDAPSLNPPAQVTVAAWIKPQGPYYSGSILCKSVSGAHVAPYVSYCLYMNPEAGLPPDPTNPPLTMYLAYGGGGAYVGPYGGNGWDVNAWTHVAGSYDGTTVRTYINGEEVASVVAGGPITTNTGNLLIGLQREDQAYRPGWEKFTGAVDEVRLYDRALDPCEVKELAGATCEPADTTPPVIVADVNGVQGEAGWYVSDVTVTWDVSDPESEVTSPACGATSVTADTAGLDVTCDATSAGGSASEMVTITRDATAPVVTFTGNAGTYALDDDVAITCSATDALSGIADATCDEASGAAYAFGGGSHAVSAAASDVAGNTATAETTFTVEVTFEGLEGLVRRFVSKAGIANSLAAKLRAAAKARTEGGRAGPLGAFRHEVEAQTGKAIGADDAAVLIALVGQL